MKEIQYEHYRLSRVVSVLSMVSADYLDSPFTEPQPHSHDAAWELCWCIGGGMTVYQRGTAMSLSAGQCLLIPPSTEHYIQLPSHRDLCFVVSFACAGSYLSLLRDRIIDASDRQKRQFQEILHELRSAFQLEQDQVRVWHFLPSTTSPFGAEQLICCYLEEILIEFLREVTRQEAANARHTSLEDAVRSQLAGQVTEYIRSHINEPLSVESLCAWFHYSRSRLGSIYKAATGRTLSQSITAEKIAHAKLLLEEGKLTMTEISEQLCFSSPQYFSNKFTAETGSSPSRYAGRFKGNR